MAKKQAKRAVKKPARSVKSKSATTKKSSTTKSRAKKDEKYEQTGAPWWKMHLPE